MVENLPTNAGDMVSIPGPGRSQLPRSNYRPCATITELHLELLSPRAAATEARAPQQEEPPRGEACTRQLGRSSFSLQKDKDHATTKTYYSQNKKIKQLNIYLT